MCVEDHDVSVVSENEEWSHHPGGGGGDPSGTSDRGWLGGGSFSTPELIQ